MSETPTPGQIAYEKYRAYAGNTYWHHYDRLGTHEQRAWEAAAQAVLAQGTPREETPCDTA
jgi:hypothetical protein